MATKEDTFNDIYEIFTKRTRLNMLFIPTLAVKDEFNVKNVGNAEECQEY